MFQRPRRGWSARARSAFAPAVAISLSALALASSCGRRAEPAPPSWAEVRALLERIEWATDLLDPATIKPILAENDTLAEMIAAFDEALRAAPRPELWFDAREGELLVEIAGHKASDEDNAHAVFELWVDELRIGAVERLDDPHGLKVLADTARIEAGGTKVLELSPHLLRPGLHILYYRVHPRHRNLNGTLRLCQRARDGSDTVAVSAERGFSTDDANYQSAVPIVFGVSLGKAAADPQ